MKQQADVANQAKRQIIGSILILIATLAYVAVFPSIFAIAPHTVAAFTAAPVILAAWYFRITGGLLALALAMPLNAWLFSRVGLNGWQQVRNNWPGVLTGLLIGMATGWLSRLMDRVRLQASALEQERAALRYEIAERKRVEEALRQARDAANAANQAKSSFLSNMSHELRTPLTTILGYTELLRLQAEQNSDAALNADLTTIQASGNHLLTLINDLLDLAKIEAGKQNLEPETFDIHDLVAEINTMILPLFEKHKNQLVINYADTISTLYADRLKLKQILLNLLSNAAQYTQRGTVTLTIEYLAEPSEPAISFAVADTGIGMSQEQISQLFQAFTTFNSMTPNNGRSTGLGLSLSRHFCQMMGGTISVSSTLGKGSQFIVRLPLQATPAPKLPRAEAAVAPLP